MRFDTTVTAEWGPQNSKEETDVDLTNVLSPLTLPCGRVLSNRLVKAATYEHLSCLFGGPPTADHIALYSLWGSGRWGMITTGNVQISRQHLTLGADMIIPTSITEGNTEGFKELAKAMKGLRDCIRSDGHEHGQEKRHSALAIMQLSHSGRQSPNVIGGRWPFFQAPLSASATRVGSSPKQSWLSRIVYALLFQTAREMSQEDVREVVDGFVRGARMALESGFDGVQLHAAHGYLLAQFISRKTNLRADAYSPPLALLHTVVCAIRAAVPKSFILGIKLNVADYTSGGLSEKDGQQHLVDIASWDSEGASVDYIEISGGDYESPDFMRDNSVRQTFFDSFSRIAVETIEAAAKDSQNAPLIMLTGGLGSRTQFSSVLGNKHAHVLGLARLATLQPDLPRQLYDYCLSNQAAKEAPRPEKSGSRERPSSSSTWAWESQSNPAPSSPSWWPRIVGAGVGMAWYSVAMRRLARNQNLPYGEGWLRIVLEMYLGELLLSFCTLCRSRTVLMVLSCTIGFAFWIILPYYKIPLNN